MEHNNSDFIIKNILWDVFNTTEPLDFRVFIPTSKRFNFHLKVIFQLDFLKIISPYNGNIRTASYATSVLISPLIGGLISLQVIRCEEIIPITVNGLFRKIFCFSCVCFGPTCSPVVAGRTDRGRRRYCTTGVRCVKFSK